MENKKQAVMIHSLAIQVYFMLKKFKNKSVFLELDYSDKYSNLPTM
ncbi:hypothetical protein [Oceanobacillus neutriphilus]|nr:hypothetical protein [Oceanobacillus neutriphilus]